MWRFAASPAGVAGLIALSFALVLGPGWVNQYGPARARLELGECRFNRALPNPLGEAPGLTLRTVSLYRPHKDPRPAGALALSFGLRPDDLAPVRAMVAVEAKGPAVAAWRARIGAPPAFPPLVVRDVAKRRADLQRRYANHPAILIVPGEIRRGGSDGAISLDMRVKTLHLTAAQTRFLNTLDGQAGPECQPRFVADLVVGALGTPFIAELRPIVPAP
ncbi:MAG: hypothetical protein ACFB22_12240 [Rhodothalassiaceae bacterium]